MGELAGEDQGLDITSIEMIPLSVFSSFKNSKGYIQAWSFITGAR